MNRLLIASIVLTVPVLAQADSPAFDRPGIGFSTQTLPAGAFSWEQGLPDVVHDSHEGSSSTLSSADTRVRVGLGSNVELQLADAVYNRLVTHDAVTTVDHGYGDLAVALKVALPPPAHAISWALMGGVSLKTGQAPFRNDSEEYSLAVSTSLHVNDSETAGLYGGVVRSGHDTRYTLSPNFGWAVNDRLSAYVEGGYTFGHHMDKDEVAGGGLAWMAGKSVQLDLFGLHGLNSGSTTLQAGVGVSIYFP